MPNHQYILNVCWPVCMPCCSVLSESLEACLDQGYSADASLLRQTRKAELMSCVLGHSPGSQGPQTGLLLDLELKEQKLVRPLQMYSASHAMTPSGSCKTWLTRGQ